MLSVNVENCEGIQLVYIKLSENDIIKTEAYDKDHTIILDFDITNSLVGIELVEITPKTDGMLGEIAAEYDIDEMKHHFKVDKLKEAFA